MPICSQQLWILVIIASITWPSIPLIIIGVIGSTECDETLIQEACRRKVCVKVSGPRIDLRHLGRSTWVVALFGHVI
jgi:hypothetical protein